MRRKLRKDAAETRRRLLAAAAEAFAEKGFWEATHAEICQTAQANTAAVNYHFGSKENLYVEAWKYSFEESVKAHPPDGGVGPEAPAAERLRGRILAFMQRMADPNNHEVEILHREMANPTGLLTEVLTPALEPQRQALRAIIRELLGGQASEQQVFFSEMSLMGQCFGPMLHLRQGCSGSRVLHPPGPPLEFDVEDLVDHIVQFTLAGIEAIRTEAQKGRKVSEKQHRRGHGLKK
ncbi:MAG: CerR family C-terminal domain-containing protein [Sedimentisphaerales bacterium]|nr:CerR family C-terminal domain-containing protein [Sedimentisphaerales bacterium]